MEDQSHWNKIVCPDCSVEKDWFSEFEWEKELWYGQGIVGGGLHIVHI
jgi:hypothetical protein